MQNVDDNQHLTWLKRLRAAGLEARCILDVGASTGTWSRVAHSVFPLAELHLFEPLAEQDTRYRQGIDHLLTTPGVRGQVHPIALDDKHGVATMRMTDWPVEASLLPDEKSDHFPYSLGVPTVSLDEYMVEADIPPPELIKLDTQGSELRILHGASSVLDQVQAIVAEVWTWPAYGPDTPLLSEVAQWLLVHGFLIADFGDEYRDDEGRLAALDLVFARPWLRLGSTMEPARRTA